MEKATFILFIFTRHEFNPSIPFKTGEFPLAAHEVIDPYFLLFSSACWNGVALGAIDVAKKHVTRTEHADMGVRVADYPIIQVIVYCPE